MERNPPGLAELEQQRLLLLTGFKDGSRRGIRDGHCAYCGIRKAAVLCSVCEARRQRLAEKYPIVLIDRMRQVTDTTTAREWSPHNSE